MKFTQRIRGAVNALRGISGTSSFANPSPEVLQAFGAQPSRTGVEVNPRTAMSASAVFACVRNLGEDEAKLPFITYRNLDPRGKEKLPAHPAYRLMQYAPNPEQTAFEVRQTLTAMAVLYGNGRAEIERNGSGIPIALWPIEPWRIRPLRNATGGLYYAVDGGRVQLAQEDVLDIRGFSVCGLVGEMVTSHGRDSFGLAIATERFAATFFGNGARSSGVIEHPLKMSDKAYENLKRSINDNYTGVENAHKMWILEEGAKYNQQSTPPEEAQMIETRQFSVEDVARWFRMPPHKIGHLERAQGWSTLESANTDYLIDTIMPWAERWEQEVKRKLIQPSEPDVFAEHLFAGMLRGDTTARYAAYAQALNTGWMCIDEIRELENLNPVPGGFGSIHRVPLNFKSIETPDAPPKLLPPTDPAPAPTAEPAAPTDPTPADPTIEPLRSLAADAVRRVLRVEMDKVRRASAKPNFGEWVDAFYAAHAEYIGNALNPVCRAFGKPDFDSSTYAATARDQLRAAIGRVSEAEVSDAVESILSGWEAGKATAIARQIAGD